MHAVGQAGLDALASLGVSPRRSAFVLVALVDEEHCGEAAQSGVDLLIAEGASESMSAAQIVLAEHRAMAARKDSTAPAPADRERLALEQGTDSIVITNPKGEIEFANSALLQSTGYRIEELIGRTPRIFKSEVHGAAVFEAMWRTLTRGETWIGELVNRKKDGTEFMQEVTISPVCDATGETIHFIAVKRDISERKRIEEALKASEERFRVLVEGCPAILFGPDRDGVFQISEGAGLASLGLAPGEVVGQSAFDLYADHPLVIEKIRAALDGEKVVYVLEIGELSFDIFYSPVHGPEGEVIGMFGMAIEITERRLAEAAARESEERLRALLDSTPDYLMLLDEELVIQVVNRVTHGFAEDEVVGHSVLEFALPDEREGIRAHLEHVVEAGEVRRFDSSIVVDGVRTHFTSIAAPVCVAGRVTSVVVSTRDMTQTIQLELERSRLEEQYQHAQKMEAVGQLAGGVAHDFNNVLSVITSNAALALMDLPRVDPLRSLMEEIEEAADRAAEFTRQLMAFPAGGRRSRWGWISAVSFARCTRCSSA